jgi:hypothetical protein
MSDSVTADISWTPVLEKYFAETGEKSEGLAWMHGESELLYTSKRTWIDLPVIIGSGIVGFLNAASSSLFSDPVIASVALGVGSLVIGTMNTLGSYFGFARRAEGHRIAALSYHKLSRFLRVEMGLPRDERMRPGDLLKMIKTETDRLAETAPAVPPEVRDLFRKRFKAETVAKPPEVNGLHHVEVFVETTQTLEVSSPVAYVPPLSDAHSTLTLRMVPAPSDGDHPPAHSALGSATSETRAHS